ncbi:carbohydrate sulfotransferase 11 [Cylas formicarius]|uniref:carbohydrate sulfotransferase 11 n=1 Tax=Cylas formicarius TaxID=197179 RepID=UPI002958710C|nr:carbohydrate sulfotransferase 11 [Cylas formicarius]
MSDVVSCEKSSLDRDIESLSHEDLCEITQSSLRRLIASDPLLSDLPVDVITEEVHAQIAVIQGQSITVTIGRYSETPLNVVIACTNWKRVMMVLTGRSNVSNLVDIPASVAHANYSTVRLSQLPPSEIRTVLREYTLFLIVRHPFERLLSAYRNKFTETLPSSKYFQARYGKEIIKKYRRGAVSSDANVTFSEFVAYLLDEGAETNEHWRPVYDMCLPCTLNYTFVGRYETLVEDARTVLNMVGAPPLAFPVTRPARTRDNLKRYYQELSVYTIGRLYRRYLADFKLFGYGLEDLLGYDLA